MTLECSHVSCYGNAKWIAVIDENTRSEKYLTTSGRCIVIVTNTRM